MTPYICTTCGVQFAEAERAPDRCPICEDERQYVNWHGQTWTTPSAMRDGHGNTIRTEEPHLTGIGTEPQFAIGQRALLVQTPGGNVLWDCISLIDDPTIRAVQALGGISAIAISHPHFYASMVDWSRTFGGAPIYLHASDRAWVMRPDRAIVFWESETYSLGDGVTLLRCGGHFEGATVLHWGAGAGERGALLVGDTLQVVFDRRHVSFMRSYPNLIPLSPSAIHRIMAALAPFTFDRVYGSWFGRVISEDGQAAVARSASRYVRAVQER